MCQSSHIAYAFVHDTINTSNKILLCMSVQNQCGLRKQTCKQKLNEVNRFGLNTSSEQVKTEHKCIRHIPCILYNHHPWNTRGCGMAAILRKIGSIFGGGNCPMQQKNASSIYHRMYEPISLRLYAKIVVLNLQCEIPSTFHREHLYSDHREWRIFCINCANWCKLFAIPQYYEHY